MDYHSWVIIIISLLLSGFFSGMEIAFISANKLKIELDHKAGFFTARILSQLIRRPKRFIAAMLVGNNLALVFYGVYAGELIANYFFGVSDWSIASNPTIALIVQTLLSTIVILLTAEFLPKSIFRLNPNMWLTIFSFPLMLVYILFFIPASFVVFLSKFFLKTFLKADTHNEEVEFKTVDLDHYLRDVTENLDPNEELENELQILQNALDFKDVKARDCQVPRNEIIACSIDDDIDVLTRKFIDSGYSKIVIYRDNIDNIIGYVHSFDLFKKPEHIKNSLLPPIFVPEPMPANEVLEQFIKKKRNMAVVLDEFGGTSGIITIEDIVEEIFGEIEDEHDNEDLVESEIGENRYLFSARLEIDYLNDKYKIDLPKGDDYETLGGLITNIVEEIPEEKSIIEHEDFEFIIAKAMETRIELVELYIKERD